MRFFSVMKTSLLTCFCLCELQSLGLQSKSRDKRSATICDTSTASSFSSPRLQVIITNKQQYFLHNLNHPRRLKDRIWSLSQYSKYRVWINFHCLIIKVNMDKNYHLYYKLLNFSTIVHSILIWGVSDGE